MASANLNTLALSQKLQDRLMLEYERETFLLNCAVGNPTHNESLAADYINELKLKVEQLNKKIKENKQ
jgi:hypothetical protein|tara:strand:+ start:6166 stop:6369 length:204 start_codon:yes stop_codon:yes gene_type:complete